MLHAEIGRNSLVYSKCKNCTPRSEGFDRFTGPPLQPRSYASAMQVLVVLKLYVSLPVLAASILCIIITIIVVTRRGLWRPAITYTVVLAVVDLFTLLLISVLSLDYFAIRFLSETYQSRIYYTVEAMAGELVDTLLFISNWLTAMLATERYIAICFPLRSRRISGKHRKMAIVLTVIVSIAFKTPGFILAFPCEDSCPPPNSLFLRKLYIWTVQFVLYLFVPFILLTFVNLRLIQAVRRSSKLFQKPHQKTKNTAQKTGPISSCVRNTPECLFTQMKLMDKHENGRSDCMRVLRNARLCERCSSSSDGPRDSLSSSANLTSSARNLTSVRDASGNEISPNQCVIGLTLNGPVGNHLQRANKEERKITITLVLLIITFFIFQGPFELISVASQFGSFFTSTTPVESVNSTNLSNSSVESKARAPDSVFHFETYLRPLSVIALALKSDLYFLFYCWFCDRFLHSLRKLIRPSRLRRWSRACRSSCSRRRPSDSGSVIRLNMPKGVWAQHYALPQHINGQYLTYHNYGGTGLKRYPNNDLNVVRSLRGYKQPLMPFILSPKKRSRHVLHRSRSLSWVYFDAHRRNDHSHCSCCNPYNSEGRVVFRAPPTSYCSQRRVAVRRSNSKCQRLRIGTLSSPIRYPSQNQRGRSRRRWYSGLGKSDTRPTKTSMNLFSRITSKHQSGSKEGTSGSASDKSDTYLLDHRLKCASAKVVGNCALVPMNCGGQRCTTRSALVLQPVPTSVVIERSGSKPGACPSSH
ncbi:unnamed protein product [Calicophoron daubneyi]|uniref:G-protein coupled receptors family 1 profile domain-containing protein n=1 Tax=Calicophoron daubneyi TaxID=300641 RepID=A0AAV2T3D5_CALDB